jgi:transposase
MRYELTEYEWAAIKPFLPNKPRGVARVNDRRVLNGILWVLRSGAPWRDLPENYGPYTTCYNRFVRWRRAGVWGGIINALAGAHDAAVQMIDTSIARVHQHAACIADQLKAACGWEQVPRYLIRNRDAGARRGFYWAGSFTGHSRSPDFATLALAKLICRTADWFDPRGVPRSYHRSKRTTL